MSEAIIAAVIAVAGSIIVQLIISRDAKRKDSVERAVRQQKLDDKLEQIDIKLTEHNAYGAKFAALAETFEGVKQSLALVERDIQYLKEGRFDQRSA